MQTHQTPPIKVPLNGSPAEVAELARQVGEFLEGPVYPIVAAAIRSYQSRLSAMLMGQRPTGEAVSYADRVGEMRGVGRIEQILRGVVETGKEAEAEIRKAEEEGSS